MGALSFDTYAEIICYKAELKELKELRALTRTQPANSQGPIDLQHSTNGRGVVASPGRHDTRLVRK